MTSIVTINMVVKMRKGVVGSGTERLVGRREKTRKSTNETSQFKKVCLNGVPKLK